MRQKISPIRKGFLSFDIEELQPVEVPFFLFFTNSEISSCHFWTFPCRFCADVCLFENVDYRFLFWTKGYLSIEAFLNERLPQYWFGGLHGPHQMDRWKSWCFCLKHFFAGIIQISFPSFGCPNFSMTKLIWMSIILCYHLDIKTSQSIGWLPNHHWDVKRLQRYI